ncbi:MAG TPA: hypothetical protein VGM83_05810 [Devosiaceae bacterium]|jgi:hypothetical protein
MFSTRLQQEALEAEIETYLQLSFAELCAVPSGAMSETERASTLRNIVNALFVMTATISRSVDRAERAQDDFLARIHEAAAVN